MTYNDQENSRRPPRRTNPGQTSRAHQTPSSQGQPRPQRASGSRGQSTQPTNYRRSGSSAQRYARESYGSPVSPGRYPVAGGAAAGRGATDHHASPATTRRSFPAWGIAAIVAALIVVVAIAGFAIARGHSGNSTATNASTNTDATSSAQMVAEDKTMDTTTISFTMSFTGDCCLGNDENFGYSGRMPEYYDNYGPTYFFQNVKYIFDADDYTVVDMEGTFTTRTTRNGEQFAFKADPEYVDILTYGNVQAATLANNHSSDYGAGSYTDTGQTLEEAGIVPFGYDDIAYVDIKGVKVALIGMYELDEYLGIMDNMLENIQKAKDNNAQVIVMCAHWGEEKMYVPDEIQVELAHAAIDAGCDLIVGCHPHRVQGIEIYKGKYIAYSMGNFCFCGNNAPADMDCYIFQQTFTLVGGQLQIDSNVNVIPCSISSDDSINNYQPTPATGAQATEINDKIADCNAQLASTYGVTTM